MLNVQIAMHRFFLLLVKESAQIARAEIAMALSSVILWQSGPPSNANSREQPHTLFWHSSLPLQSEWPSQSIFRRNYEKGSFNKKKAELTFFARSDVRPAAMLRNAAARLNALQRAEHGPSSSYQVLRSPGASPSAYSRGSCGSGRRVGWAGSEPSPRACRERPCACAGVLIHFGVRNARARHACPRAQHDRSKLLFTVRSRTKPLAAPVLPDVCRERVVPQALEHRSGAGERGVRRERAPALRADARSYG